MKLAKHYLEQVAYANHLQSIALIIFFVLFAAAMIWILTGPNKMYAENGNLPLEDDDFDSFTDNFENNTKTE